MSTVIVPIINPSFEQVSGPFPDADPCGPSGWDGEGAFRIPGWQWQANTGVIKLSNPNPCGIDVPPPDGLVVAHIEGSTISQDTGVKASDLQQNGGLQRSGFYTLTFSVTNYFPTYPGYFEGKLFLGANELGSVDGWAREKWTQVILVCPSPGYLVYDQWPDWTGNVFDPNAHLIISLSANGWKLLFDNVSLTFTPSN